MRTGSCLIIILVLGGLSPGAASAYDPQRTHRWLTRQAAERLVRAYPGRYDELLSYLDEVADGNEEEDHRYIDGDADITTLRVMRHFFRPTDQKGFTYGERTFPNSFEWGMGPRDDNPWDWQDGQRAYARGDRALAYRILGHVTHLVQDLTVPAHTHLDSHGPPTGDDYEEYCSRQMMDEHVSLLPVPPAGAEVPLFRDAEEAWLDTAWRSYRRNLFPGDLSDITAPRGALKDMFPSLGFHWFYQDWRITDPPVGALGDGFLEAEPGLYYIKNSEHAPLYDYAPSGDAFEPNVDGASLTERMARDLIPLAILATAGIMKLYLDEAYARPLEVSPDGDLVSGAPSGDGGCRVAPSRRGGGSSLIWLGFACALALVWRKRCDA